jgi:DNA-binding protein Fis
MASADDRLLSGTRNESEIRPLAEVERELVVQAMRATDGHRTRAARLLGISRDQLRYRLRKFGLDH